MDREWIQFGAKHNDGSFTVYPSEAAMVNDPVFSRGTARTVARRMVGNTPVSEWRRTYKYDPKALRNED